eukprot:TRINITY_DN3066_c0_g1_i1.p1 TRINITY_DN3066_c0_g1~~TRINITY_DN3066_c0_g1_i1.p1  ORF type:complete len:921 (+),score=296.19 TRINITY_DN3066_c0_g1_i1:39-2801(+)
MKNYSDETVTNAVGRVLPKYIDGYGEVRPFKGAFAVEPRTDVVRPSCQVRFDKPGDCKIVENLEQAMDLCGLDNGMTISYHHHLRNGDAVSNLIFDIIAKKDVKDIELAPSSVHPIQKPMIPLIKNGNVTKIHTGTNGPVGKYCSEGNLKDVVIVRSHGGRVRAIQDGDINIDIAVIAASACDPCGNCTGIIGKSACGPLAYAEADSRWAKKVIVVTDNLVPFPCTPLSISGTNVDYIVVVDSIGDPKKIASSTVVLAKSEPGLSLAKTAAKVIAHSGVMVDGFSFQAGAGGASLTSVFYLGEEMRKAGVTAGWANGGTTKVIVDLFKEGLVDKLTTCQAFDIPSIASMYDDIQHHVESSIDQYANPYNGHCVVHNLDCVVLGGTEVDVDFNVNVNTHSDGYLLHNTGGHQDTAAGAKLTIITAPVARGNNPIIVPRVTSVTTPGECVDVVVTDAGIAINPNRKDLIEALSNSPLADQIKDIHALHEEGCRRAGRVPSAPETLDHIIGVIEWRDGTVLDVVRQVANPIPDGIKLKSDCLVEVEEADKNSVDVILYDTAPVVPVDEMKALAMEMLEFYGAKNLHVMIKDNVSERWTLQSRLEYAIKTAVGSDKCYLAPLCEDAENRVHRPKEALRRSMLYIPGSSAYMMAKADGGADCVIYDMEDAVGLPQKPECRVLVRNALRAVPFGKTERHIRINQHQLGVDDILDVVKNAPLDVVWIPKVEDPIEFKKQVELIKSVAFDQDHPPYVVPLIESALGVERTFEIATVDQESVIGLSMGLEDYTKDIGAVRTKSDHESEWAQQRVNNCAAAFQLQSYDSVFSDFNDNEGLIASVKRCKGLGFVGKRLIHPNQVKPCNAAFLPEKSELDYALKVSAAFKGASGNAVALGKKMIDRPVYQRALHVIKLALQGGMIEGSMEDY